MTRNQWIRKQKAVRPLLRYLSEQGYRVSFKDKLNGDWAYGWHRQGTKDVCVYLRKPDGRFWSLPDIVFILAHEARHVEHIELGLFSKYYNMRRKHSAPKLMLMALAAERNCDASAKRYLNENLPTLVLKSSLHSRIYPLWRVCSLFIPQKMRIEKILMRIRGTKTIRIDLTNWSSSGRIKKPY